MRHEIINQHVSDGKSHQVTVELNEKMAIFRFDQQPEKIVNLELGNNSNEKLELVGPLIIGGIYPNHTAPAAVNPSLKIPPYFYSGMLGHGYVGCIQDVEINGKQVNLTHFATKEGVSGISTDICAPMPDQCDFGNCLNEGVCMEGWNRFYCDCSSTGFNGPICNQPATIANFADGQYLSIKFEPEWISEAEHFSLRFKTTKNDKQSAILLSTVSASPHNNRDTMEISLENGQVKFFVRIGTTETSLVSNEELSVNEWHTIKILREGVRLILQIDSDEPITG
jgi:leucine-rich repeat transmembrane neuronal protein 1/2